MKKFLMLLLTLMLLAAPALADTLSLEGTVVSTQSTAILAGASGVIRDVTVQAGDSVTPGQTVATLMETITYAETAGTVTIFGEAGESAETVTERNGAVMYLSPDSKFTISASTRNAYDEPENKIIRPGETVYVRCTANNDHTGTGVVIALSGSSYTVEITQGTFEDGESVYLFRDPAFAATSRIGRGTAAYADPLACTGSGMITQLLVSDGAHVEKGTPLFSTVNASAFSGLFRSHIAGTVASVNVTPGTQVEEGAILAVVYPDHARLLQILADEIDLRGITPGQQLTLTFTNGVIAQGQVDYISCLPYTPEESTEEDSDACFPVYVTFSAEAPVAYGMTATVTQGE